MQICPTVLLFFLLRLCISLWTWEVWSRSAYQESIVFYLTFNMELYAPSLKTLQLDGYQDIVNDRDTM